ncbi:MAG: DUF739 family protein [Oscillospiraceae bacterium]|nr:DUF739 family protein [Oscillospiraceae bacterium]
MSYDYSRLAGKITKKYCTQAKFAEAMNLSERTISLKLNGKIDWKQAEIKKACELLGIGVTKIPDYFFTVKVQD